MLHLSIDVNEGAGIIPCPRCGQALLLGFEKMGRLIVLYDGPVKRSRGPALLVCPEVDCSHQEPVHLVKDNLDAIAFNPFCASHIFMARQEYRDRSLAEMGELIRQLKRQYKETQNPKLPSLVRFWRERFEYTRSSVSHSVHEAHRKKGKIHLIGPNLDETGYIKAIQENGVYLQRVQTNEEVFCEAGQLHSAWLCAMVLDLEELDEEEETGPGCARNYGNPRIIYEPSCFAVVEGHTFELERTSFYGWVRLRTKDAALARSYGFVESTPGYWVGEWPSALVQRAYRRIRLCRVGGYRMRISSATSNPEVFQVETHHYNVAAALGMPKSGYLCSSRRGAVRSHYRFFHHSEVDRIEEIQVPYKLSLPRARAHRKR